MSSTKYEVLLITFFSILFAYIPAAHALLEWSLCAEDVKKYCPDMVLGSDRAANCLKQLVETTPDANKKITLACYSTIQHWQFHSICKSDIEKLCSNVPPGEHRIHNCMKEYADKTNQACHEFIRHYLKISGAGETKSDLDC